MGNIHSDLSESVGYELSTSLRSEGLIFENEGREIFGNLFAPNLIVNPILVFQALTWLKVEGQYSNLSFSLPPSNFVVLPLFIHYCHSVNVCNIFCCFVDLVVFAFFWPCFACLKSSP